jgi:hypothetical protein
MIKIKRTKTHSLKKVLNQYPQNLSTLRLDWKHNRHKVSIIIESKEKIFNLTN